MTHSALEILKRYISKHIDIAQMIYDREDGSRTIEIKREVHGCTLVATIEYNIEREYYTEYSTDNLTPSEDILKDWTFTLDSQQWIWIDGDTETDITADVQINESDIENQLDKIISYYNK